MSETEGQIRLVKGLHADFVPAKWSGSNTSGIKVIGHTVLVLPDDCAEISTGAGGAAILSDAGVQAKNPNAGVALPVEMLDRMNQGSEQGRVVGVADGAFRIFKDGRRWQESDRPKTGDRIYFEKYAGRLVRGKDGVVYRIMEDSCVGAIYEDDPEESEQGKAA